MSYILALLWLIGPSQRRPLAQIPPSENTAPTPEPAVIERGPFWRTWRTTTREVDPVTAAVTERVAVYTELGAGMHYHDGEGWVESEPLIELSPAGGAEAVRGQHKAFLPPTLAAPVRLTMPGGQLFALQPLGLYYFDAASGRAAQLAEVDPEVSGLLLPPNRIVYLKAFGELGDAVYVHEVNRLDRGSFSPRRHPRRKPWDSRPPRHVLRFGRRSTGPLRKRSVSSS